MCIRMCATVILTGLLITSGARAQTTAPDSAPTPEAIDQAIVKGKQWLYSQHTTQGNWEREQQRDPKAWDGKITGGQWGGQSALTVYTLLAAGEPATEPRLAKGVQFLRTAEIPGTYALAMRVLAFSLLPQIKENRDQIFKDGQMLVKLQKTAGNAAGHYDYLAEGTTYSHSRSQYGILGAWFAQQRGASVPEQYWKRAEDGWVHNQDASGGWSYKHQKDNEHAVTPGMTAAGLASLFIALDYNYATWGLQPQGNFRHPAIERGLKWLGDNMDKVASDTSYARDYPYATLYAVERMGVAGGYKYIGKTNWFAQGAQWIIKKQRGDGSWTDSSTARRGDIADSCMALLFLARGRTPLAMGKLQYELKGADGKSAPANWNQRPRDVANLTRYLGYQLERELNWQIINLQAPVEELLETPVLLMDGNQALRLSPEHEQALRDYVLRGGLLVGHADGSADAFATSFQQMGKRWFPQAVMRELPADHPIYTRQQFLGKEFKAPIRVQGLSNGARELMLLFPTGDPGRGWQERAFAQPERQAYVKFMANAFMYVADIRNLPTRGDSHWIKLDPNKNPSQSVTVARLTYPGNSDPEPAGWQLLTNYLHNQQNLKLTVTPIELGQQVGEDIKVAHLTGTATLKLNAEQKAALLKFVTGGGTLIVDACGGQSAFAHSVLTELSDALQIKPEQITAVPGELPLAQMSKVAWRKYLPDKTEPLKGLQMRYVKVGSGQVYYSAHDISTALVGQAVDGVWGYTPETARQIMTTLLKP